MLVSANLLLEPICGTIIVFSRFLFFLTASIMEGSKPITYIHRGDIYRERGEYIG